MILNTMKLVNFRNYENFEISFSKGINIIYGKNAQGKTNLLESIYVLALTKSHRSFIDHNLIKDGETSSKICGKVEKDGISTEYQVLLETKKKKCYVDKDELKKLSDYISNLNIIIFYPEDLEIIKGSPQLRRRYINMEISQLDRNYFQILNDYTRLLKMRNDYLKKMSSFSEMEHPYFIAVTEYLIEKAAFLYKMRMKFIKRLNDKCESIFFDISGKQGFRLRYDCSFNLEDLTLNEIKEILKQKFLEVKAQEYRVKTTMIGPHKDDLSFLLGNTNLKHFGSQGQQRMAILALKLSEIAVFTTYCNSKPILLLDDVFSELDEIKKNNLLSYIDGEIQTIITTTEISNIEDSILAKSKLIEIEDGAIKSITEVIEHG